MPAGIPGMLSFLAEANDSRYVIVMERYLFRGEGGMTLQSDGSLLSVALTSNRVNFLNVAWELRLMSRKVIYPMDFALLQEEGILPRSYICDGRVGRRTKLIVKLETFPDFPTVVERWPPVNGLAMPIPRVSQYVSALIGNCDR